MCGACTDGSEYHKSLVIASCLKLLSKGKAATPAPADLKVVLNWATTKKSACRIVDLFPVCVMCELTKRNYPTQPNGRLSGPPPGRQQGRARCGALASLSFAT